MPGHAVTFLGGTTHHGASESSPAAAGLIKLHQARHLQRAGEIYCITYFYFAKASEAALGLLKVTVRPPSPMAALKDFLTQQTCEGSLLWNHLLRFHLEASGPGLLGRAHR